MFDVCCVLCVVCCVRRTRLWPIRLWPNPVCGVCGVCVVYVVCVVCVVCGVCVCTRQPENSKRAHLRSPALQTPPKFHERTPKREKKERKMWRERKKNAKFWAVRQRGAFEERGGPGEGGSGVRWTFSPTRGFKKTRGITCVFLFLCIFFSFL